MGAAGAYEEGEEKSIPGKNSHARVQRDPSISSFPHRRESTANTIPLFDSSEIMDRENGKRKAVPSPRAETSRSGPRGSKIRKLNPAEGSLAETPVQTQVQIQEQTQTPTQVQTQVQTRSNRRPRSSDLVKKLVAAWTGGSQGQHPLMTQESVREGMALQDHQDQCSEAESMVRMFQQKVKAAEAVIGNLKHALKIEGKEKADLINKMNATGQLTETISDHINYITDTLGRCQQHQKHLSKLYNSVILKQKEDYAKLTNREEKLQKQLMNSQNKVAALEKDFETARHAGENKFNQMQRAYEAEFAKVREESGNTKKQLEALDNEKNAIADRLASEEQTTLDLEKKIHEYDNEVNKLTDQLTRVSGNLRSLIDEKSQWQIQLAEKDRNLLQIVEELDSATIKITELSAKVSEINSVNNELEEKLKCELNERDTLSKSLNARIEDLTRQVESLRESKDEAVKEFQQSKEEAIKEMEKSKEEAVIEVQRSKEEAVNDMQKKIEIAEKERNRISAESKSINNELVQKYERILKVQQEKYESCVAEIKTMEVRHKCELSRTNTSSSTELASVKAEKRQMERELDKLKREKDRLEVQFRQTEDLLLQHTKSEMLLQKKLDQAQSDATDLANTAAKAVAEKKRVDDDKEEKICKIKELEKELLNLQFNNAKSTPIEASNTNTVKDIDQRDKERAKKPTVVASSALKKSILKRTPKPRRTRSTPPSPVMTPSLLAADKKTISFDLDSSSDASPVKLDNPAKVNKFINSESLFNDMIATGKSSSQPMQASLVNSQNSMTQVQSGGRKFFKSRVSQSK